MSISVELLSFCLVVGGALGSVLSAIIMAAVSRKNQLADLEADLKKDLNDQIRELQDDIRLVRDDVDLWRKKYYVILQEYVRLRERFHATLSIIRAWAVNIGDESIISKIPEEDGPSPVDAMLAESSSGNRSHS